MLLYEVCIYIYTTLSTALAGSPGTAHKPGVCNIYLETYVEVQSSAMMSNPCWGNESLPGIPGSPDGLLLGTPVT